MTSPTGLASPCAPAHILDPVLLTSPRFAVPKNPDLPCLKQHPLPLSANADSLAFHASGPPLAAPVTGFLALLLPAVVRAGWLATKLQAIEDFMFSVVVLWQTSLVPIGGSIESASQHRVAAVFKLASRSPGCVPLLPSLSRLWL